MMKKQKIKKAWTCSDFVYHEHRTKVGAWICGRWQRLFHSVKPIKFLSEASDDEIRMEFTRRTIIHDLNETLSRVESRITYLAKSKADIRQCLDQIKSKGEVDQDLRERAMQLKWI